MPRINIHLKDGTCLKLGRYQSDKKDELRLIMQQDFAYVQGEDNIGYWIYTNNLNYIEVIKDD